MHRPAALLLLAGACTHPSAWLDAAPADAGVPIAVVVDSSAVVDASDASETPDVAPRSCGDLDAAEKAALQTCAGSRIHGLGIHGAFTIRVAMSGTSLPRTRAENDIEHKFRDALPGDACDRAATLLAAHLPCTWDVHGPFPAWTIRVVSDPQRP